MTKQPGSDEQAPSTERLLYDKIAQLLVASGVAAGEEAPFTSIIAGDEDIRVTVRDLGGNILRAAYRIQSHQLSVALHEVAPDGAVEVVSAKSFNYDPTDGDAIIGGPTVMKAGHGRQAITGTILSIVSHVKE